MKKILLASFLLSAATLSFGLDTMSLKRFKPVKCTFTTQVGIAFATLDPNVLSMGLNGRCFLRERLAVRATVIMDNQKEVENFYEFPDNTGGKGKFTTTQKTTFLFLGVEKHFRGTNRLSPYVGVECGYGMGSLKEEGENSAGTSFFDAYSEESTSKISQINTGAFLGFDYWVAHGLYIGIEYSFFGHFAFVEKESDKSVTMQGVTTKTNTPEMRVSGFTTVNSIPVFRLGWIF